MNLMKRSVWLSAAALAAGLCLQSTGAFGQVTGTVKLDGKAPPRQPVAGLANVKDCAALHKEPLLDETVVADDDGNLANVVVYLKGDNVKGAAPKEPAKLDQKGCQYSPHVLDMTVGQQLLAINSDTFLHNVHTLPEENQPSNNAQPTKDEKGVELKPVKAPEIFRVKCDVHPWMNAWVAAFPHPYHATTGEDGAYEIKTAGLPDGEYTIVAWQEKYKESAPQKVTIKGGKADKPVNFTFKQKAAAADPKDSKAADAKDAKDVKLASLTGEPCCEECAKPAAKKGEVAATK